CPFCNTDAFSVEHRGKRTAAERHADLLEEQRAVEAMIRMQVEAAAAHSARLAGQTSPAAAEADTAAESGEEAAGAASPALARTVSASDSEENMEEDAEELMLSQAIWLSLQ
ncbi:unnamed protein product, partial [Closterium sp. NIES-65]